MNNADMIINVTQHKATPEQLKVGVIDMPEEASTELAKLLTFEELPTQVELTDRAKQVVDLVRYHFTGHQVMIGGAPFFMAQLERQFKYEGMSVYYSFSRRESVDVTKPDGSVQKTSVFRHIGFVEA